VWLIPTAIKLDRRTLHVTLPLREPPVILNGCWRVELPHRFAGRRIVTC